ncbi:MAG TPA: peptide deformylase [Dictyoglomaceae bacterium]|nr:peptide deformylase [Dictyoglomaceae bacterium]HOL39089.1 peptide deformylase [Dictyoglomaceae bacterium]HOP94302.1 peptide deformylase [Dictyoglomaceae bacterium]HPP15243.1 peptide deformylase [Dictyoglomaceae bacterium]HPU42649.1 peptide deformylase [Dictyoglomaceae bacterium]
MILEIRKIGDPILKKKAKNVEKIDEKIKKLIEDMFETMKFADGVGLAAPQVGESLRVIVIDFEENSLVLINPKIIEQEEENMDLEGCLSIPGIEVPVKRAEKIVFEAQDINGKLRKYKAKGLFARIIQHEMDHLDGVLIIDRILEENVKV